MSSAPAGKPPRFQFHPPATFDESDERLAILYADSSMIEAQLGSREREMKINGYSDQDRGYLLWRSKAQYALAIKRAETGFLRAWRRHAQEKMDREMVQARTSLRLDHPVLALLSALHLAKKGGAAGALSKDEQRWLDLAYDQARDWIEPVKQEMEHA